MIYTVGNKQDYDYRLHRAQFEKLDFAKVGPKGDYGGGIVFENIAAATRFLLDRNKLGLYAVYGVDADWNNDTLPDRVVGKPYHRLQRDAKISQLQGVH